MIEMLWPTPIVMEYVGSEELNLGLLEASDLAQHSRFTNIWDIDHPAIRELQAHFIRLATQLAETRKELFGVTPPELTTERGWMNVHRNSDWTSPHNHSRAAYAGVYYVKAEGNCGDLLLQDPAAMSSWCGTVDGNKDCRVYKRIKSETGKMVLFPAHIVHCTDVNRTHEPRVCIATNFMPAYFK